MAQSRVVTAARWSLALLAVTSSALSAQTPEQTLDRAVAAWARVKTARATFEQTVTNSLTGSSANARGEFQQQRPNKLSIRFTDPANDRIVSDGSSVWVYLPSSTPGQVIKRSAKDENAVPIDITGEFLTDPKSRYTVTDAGTGTVAGHAAHALTLVPKPGTNAVFDRATIWVDDDDALVRQFEAVEHSGITRRIRITSLDVNVPVDRNAFTFTPPAGVRVIDR